MSVGLSVKEEIIPTLVLKPFAPLAYHTDFPRSLAPSAPALTEALEHLRNSHRLVLLRKVSPTRRGGRHAEESAKDCCKSPKTFLRILREVPLRAGGKEDTQRKMNNLTLAHMIQSHTRILTHTGFRGFECQRLN